MNPLSAIFGAGVALRNSLYDRRAFQVHKLARPVISVGNISVGGSGKTPFVIALGGLLKARGITFDVITRGYGRGSAEIVAVNPDGKPEQFGDEPLVLARKLQVPVIVGADRYRAGLLAENLFSSKLHLLDDGFQHRRLHRDFDIVLLPAADKQDTLLPIGRLREPLAALQRADAVVLPDSSDPPLQARRVWLARRRVELPDAAGKAIAFCGIGRPQQFFTALQQSGWQITGQIAFRDHHRYQQQDIDHLLALKKQTGADAFITTEKDAVNLGGLAPQLGSLRIAGLRMELESSEQVIDEMLKTLEQRSGCRF